MTPLLPRPSHWLEGEPRVSMLEPTPDGFVEVVLELGGRIVATEVLDDAAQGRAMMRRFDAIIRRALVLAAVGVEEKTDV